MLASFGDHSSIDNCPPPTEQQSNSESVAKEPPPIQREEKGAHCLHVTGLSSLGHHVLAIEPHGYFSEPSAVSPGASQRQNLREGREPEQICHLMTSAPENGQKRKPEWGGWNPEHRGRKTALARVVRMSSKASVGGQQCWACGLRISPRSINSVSPPPSSE